MVELNISPAEVESGVISAEHLSAAVDALKTDGFVVLNDIIALDHLDLILERMMEDLPTVLDRKDLPYNFHRANVQHDPPPFPPYLFRDVLVNPIVVAISKAILGKGVKNSFYSGNTAMPSDQRQPVHADEGHLWPNLEVAHPPVSLVINVPVVDMDERNGSTEIWPGTHLDTTVYVQQDTIRVPDDVLEIRRAQSPPIQPSVRRGSVLMRDMRLWHAGMPNKTDTPRPMIAMIHNAGWWPCGTLEFPAGTEPLFADSDLRTNARFVEGEIDYLHRHEAYTS
jgi:hypothetical protein